MPAPEAMTPQVTHAPGFQEPQFFLPPDSAPTNTDQDPIFIDPLKLEKPVGDGWPPQMTITDSRLTSPSSPALETTSIPEPQRPAYTNEVQRTIAEQWGPIREGVPSSAILDVLKEKAGLFSATVDGLTRDELDGKMDEYTKRNLVKQAVYVTIATVDLMTSYGVDLDSNLLRKMIKMEEKYDGNAVTESRMLGYSPLEAMAILKAMDKRGERYQFQGISIPPEEEEARKPRSQRFKNLDQAMIDRWQKSAFGTQLSAFERLPNAKGEMTELFAEFEHLSSERIDRITDPDRLFRIGDEGADVVIGMLGYLSAIDVDYADQLESALQHMTDKYRAVQKLSRKHEVPPVVVFKAIRDESRRISRGAKHSFLAATLNLVR